MNTTTPVDELAEQGVLACLFNVPSDLPLAANIISPEDFHEPRNGAIFETMLTMVNQGQNFNLVTLAGYLQNTDNLATIGGMQYLISLMNPDALYAYEADVIGYSLLVKEASQKRQVGVLGNQLMNMGRSDSGYPAAVALSEADAKLRKAMELTVKAEAVKSDIFMDDLLSSIKEREELPEGSVVGVPSGFFDLDKLTMGWKPGQMIIVAARPAMGKSTLAIDFARAAAIKAGMTAVFFSLEMSKEEILEKIICAESNVEGQKLKSGTLTAEDWDAIAEARPLIAESSLIFDDSAKINLAHIRSVCEKQKNSPEGLDIIFIDYLQLMSSGNKVESRQQEVSEISRGIKLLAKELGVPIIVLSQLNRGSEQRSDKSPMISDLRESGSLEQDADIIILIHRPEYYDTNDRPGQAFIELAKHRNGPTRTVTLIPLLHYSKFANSSGMIAAMVNDEGGDPENPPENSNFSYGEETGTFDPDVNGVPVTEPSVTADEDSSYDNLSESPNIQEEQAPPPAWE